MDKTIRSAVSPAVKRLATDGQFEAIRDFVRILERLDLGEETGCWVWPGASREGYGRATVAGKQVTVHRYMWERMRSPIPEGLTLDHQCEARLCCNPRHLKVATLAHNVSRSWLTEAENPRKNRNRDKTHCPRGHPYDERNTYLYVDGQGRRCRTCGREDAARKRVERPEQVKAGKRAYYQRHAERLREKQRARNAALRKPHLCEVCGSPVSYGGFGRPPKRCPSCR